MALLNGHYRMTKQEYLKRQNKAYLKFKAELCAELQAEIDAMNLNFFDVVNGYMTERKKRYMFLVDTIGKLKRDLYC